MDSGEIDTYLQALDDALANRDIRKPCLLYTSPSPRDS